MGAVASDRTRTTSICIWITCLPRLLRSVSQASQRQRRSSLVWTSLRSRLPSCPRCITTWAEFRRIGRRRLFATTSAQELSSLASWRRVKRDVLQFTEPVYRNGKDLHDGKAVLQDIMRKYKDVNCVDKQNLVWNTDLIETMELENLIGQVAQGLYSGEARHESRGAHAHEDFPDRNDVDWMKHTLSRLDAKHVEDAKVVLEYREVIDQPLDDQTHHVPPAKRVY